MWSVAQTSSFQSGHSGDPDLSRHSRPIPVGEKGSWTEGQVSSDHTWGVGAPGLPLCSFHFITVSKFLVRKGEVDPIFCGGIQMGKHRNFSYGSYV